MAYLHVSSNLSVVIVACLEHVQCMWNYATVLIEWERGTHPPSLAEVWDLW